MVISKKQATEKKVDESFRSLDFPLRLLLMFKEANSLVHRGLFKALK
jgi:hypothetical protein